MKTKHIIALKAVKMDNSSLFAKGRLQKKYLVGKSYHSPEDFPMFLLHPSVKDRPNTGIDPEIRKILIVSCPVSAIRLDFVELLLGFGMDEAVKFNKSCSFKKIRSFARDNSLEKMLTATRLKVLEEVPYYRIMNLEPLLAEAEVKYSLKRFEIQQSKK